MEGLNGVIFVETLHYFPFILLNLSVALREHRHRDGGGGAEPGRHGFRLFRRIVFPLAMPGYVAGASLVFIKVFDDLGTPLVLNVTNMLAPQAYLRVTSIGIEDPIGYVICVHPGRASRSRRWRGSARFLRGRDFATLQRGGAGLARRAARRWQAAFAYGWIVLVLLLVLSPHIGILLLSFVQGVELHACCPSASRSRNYATVFADSTRHDLATRSLYCGLAALPRRGARHRDRLPRAAHAGCPAGSWLDSHRDGRRWRCPASCSAIGYLRAFRGVELPFTAARSTASWVMFVLAYAVRRLPYALRSCTAALQQVHVSLEEAAQNLGASQRRTIRRVVVPLMAGGILAGFVTSFVTAAVEISETILLTSRESLRADVLRHLPVHAVASPAAGRARRSA